MGTDCRPATRKSAANACACAAVLLCAAHGAAPVSDSIPLSGRWNQNGVALTRRDMEKMLLDVPVSIADVDAAKGYRGASFAVGACLWTASAAVTAVQVVQMVEALEKNVYVVPALDGPLLSLSIASDISGLIQGRLTARSHYLLHRGARAYNEELVKKRGGQTDRTVALVSAQDGWYSQAGLALPTNVLLHVLREESASRGGSVRSTIYREFATRCGSVASGLLALAIVSYIEDKPNTSFLGVGIGLTSFAIINGIASRVARIRALRAYNAAVAPSARQEAPSGQSVAPPATPPGAAPAAAPRR